MTLLYLIRHALPAPRDSDDRDPRLGPEGAAQASAMARALAVTAPKPIFSSPLARCVMTAEPLARLWGLGCQTLEAVREVPAPGREGAQRGAFLDALLKDRWGNVLEREPALGPWRERLLAALCSIGQDSVIVSHYVAINAVVGMATGCDDVGVFRPGHASVTIVARRGGRWELVRLGQEAETRLTSG